jgi:hypothetical protein
MLTRYYLAIYLTLFLFTYQISAQVYPSDISVRMEIQEISESDRPGANILTVDAGFLTSSRYAFILDDVRIPFKKKVFVHFSFRDTRTGQTLVVDNLQLKSSDTNTAGYRVRHWFGTYYILDNNIKSKLEDELEFSFNFNGNYYNGLVHIYWRWFSDQPVTERVTSAPTQYNTPTQYNQPATTNYPRPSSANTNTAPSTNRDLIARSIDPVQSYETTAVNNAPTGIIEFNPGTGYSIQIAAWKVFPDLGQYDLPDNWPLYGKFSDDYYKVLVGPFPNRSSALAMLPSVKAAGHSRAWVAGEDGKAGYYWQENTISSVPQLQARGVSSYEAAPANSNVQARTPTAYDGVVYRPEYQRPAPQQTRRTHTVQRGDTFYSIARQYKLNVDDLQRLNPQVNPRTLQPNQPLFIE